MIYAIGDSFTYGDELDSQEQAWPAVLSKLINTPVINKGRSATGNTRIVKRAIDAAIDDAKMIIIGWTDCNRQEFADDKGIYDLWAGRQFRNARQIDNFEHRTNLIKYITAYDSPEYYYADWLRKIILVQNLCQAKNIPLIMFISCGTNDSHKQYHDKFPKLINAIDQTQFAHVMTDSVAEWTYGTPQGPNGHPLKEGHEIIANKIYEHIRNKCRFP